MEKKIETIDEYINQYNDEIKDRLIKIRKAIKEIDPSMEERISWQIPTFWKKYNIVHFAVNKNHIGIYPGGKAVGIFKDKLKDYKTSKGAIQLPHNKPIPYNLIKEIITFNLKDE